MPLAEKVQVPGSRLDAMAATFSGGNQQKLVLAKALSTQPRVLLLDEPLRGIDVGAKVEIQQLILSLASDGVGILVADEELSFLMSFADRIIVLAHGTIAGEHICEGLDPSRVLKDMFAIDQLA
jgi:rhamnose transport system ATP-binding protein